MADEWVVPYLPRHPRSDYIDCPPLIAKRTTAKRRGWYAGWPDHCPTAAARVTVAALRPQDGRTFLVSVDKRLGEIVGLLLDSIQRVGHPLIGAAEVAIAPNGDAVKQGGVSSFACRAIKGTTDQPSNHSSATALDLWSRSNVQDWSTDGSPVPFKSNWDPKAVELVAAADFYWGGWYWDDNHDYTDAMHIEYMRRPENVADSTAKLKTKIAELLPPEEPDVSATNAQVKELQATLNQMGADPQLVEDGDYGPLTRAAVLALPTKQDELLNQLTASSATLAELKAGNQDIAAQSLELANKANSALP